MQCVVACMHEDLNRCSVWWHACTRTLTGAVCGGSVCVCGTVCMCACGVCVHVVHVCACGVCDVIYHWCVL